MPFPHSLLKGKLITGAILCQYKEEENSILLKKWKTAEARGAIVPEKYVGKALLCFKI